MLAGYSRGKGEGSAVGGLGKPFEHR
jgi:hypothetical protein